MSGSTVTYPVTLAVLETLGRFLRIRKELTAELGERSDLEIIRVLGNTHDDHLEQLLGVLEEALPRAETIVRKVLQTKDPFQFEQALAELFLFRHLDAHLPGHVEAFEENRREPSPDLRVDWRDKVVLIEIYSPVDFVGNQRFERYLHSTLKFLDIPLGYSLGVEIRAVRDPDDPIRHLLYAYDMPSDTRSIRRWQQTFAGEAADWLGKAARGDVRCFCGPADVVSIDVKLREVSDYPNDREIAIGHPTKSTDTRLYFEVGTAEDTANGPWGRRLRRKMERAQCGPAHPDVLRVLAVNFALADTGWPEFINWPDIAARMREAVRMIAQDLGCPYDAVLPSDLRLVCGFGPVIVSEPEREPEIHGFIKAAGLDVAVKEEEGDGEGPAEFFAALKEGTFLKEENHGCE